MKVMLRCFFKALFELLELSERCDIRHDLVKDLRLLSDQLNEWLQHDEVDKNAVSALLSEITELIESVIAMPKQLRYFKTNRFLTSLKTAFFVSQVVVVILICLSIIFGLQKGRKNRLKMPKYG